MLERGLADALIVTGTATGREPLAEDLEKVKSAAGERPVLAGSGVDPGNAARLMAAVDGAIVGTSLKRDRQIENEVDIERVRALMKSLGR
jgi:predicted TIM-barrel enzyme